MARRCLENCVEHGNPEAMFRMGFAYFCGGWGLKMNHPNMYKYLKMAADTGNPRGMVYYARICEDDEGFGEDSKTYYQRALNSGDLFARGYYHYRNTPDNFQKAVECFTKLAIEGDEYSQFYLGDCYKYGIGVDQNTEKAIEWYTKAAEQGFYPAQVVVDTKFKWVIMADKQRYHE